MKLESIKYYLGVLVSDAHQWQYLDINGRGSAPKYYFSSSQWLILLASIGSIVLIPKGYDKDFIGYIISALSLFVGLFLTLILNLFDKFKDINFRPPHPDSFTKVRLKQKKNFYKQFTALTSYSIIISLLSIILLSLSLALDLGKDIKEYTLVKSLAEINLASMINFLRFFLFCTYRICITYFLLDFILITIYGISSYYNYMQVEYNSVKVEEETVVSTESH